jgi:hypothetical protein
VVWWDEEIQHLLRRMTVDTLGFGGDITTMLGFVGVVATLFILVTIFRSYNNSPLRKWTVLHCKINSFSKC